MTHRVSLSGGGVVAADLVFDIDDQRWPKFFRGLTASWSGWSGEKIEESLEGQLRLAATVDRLGHVAVRVAFRGDRANSDWLAEETLFVDAGRLEAIAADAEAYFGASGRAGV